MHGAAVDLANPEDLDRFGRDFLALQETLRKAIEDRSFAGTFADDALIDERWPLKE